MYSTYNNCRFVHVQCIHTVGTCSCWLQSSFYKIDVCLALLQHAVDCGGGVGIYLLVLSSYIVLVRGPRASVWGSVYPDEHGEEDRDLKYVQRPPL